MPYIHRRVFYGKVGTADRIVDQIREGDRLMAQYGVNLRSRLLTDHLSGRTDRVVWEVEVDDLNEMEADMGGVAANPEGQAAFGAWFEKLSQLIEYADVENWAIR